jgi:hypothetical protein
MSDPVDKVLREQRKTEDKPAEVDLHEDRTREVKSTSFARIRTEWAGEDAKEIATVILIADNQVFERFGSAYAVMNELWEIVREPVVLEATGEILKDRAGFAVWQKNPSGNFIEDYSKLGIKQRENLLFEITTNIMRWKQDAADLWGEAMFSKARFEEQFAQQFAQAPGTKPTEADRTQYARRVSSEERYFAIFKSLVSRKADALVDSLELIGQRLKDRTA